ncbi:F-box/LRR-repeat protein 4-like [Humulus lupulus]|uniref:F-box/LRR-repeat protein 4-like n=1 Tax=Humulus lupulus TaxID=3486 RepID=UPI002B4173C3|nr:F-box/LRR-repeat protein 4-like [Humulus lupulus]
MVIRAGYPSDPDYLVGGLDSLPRHDHIHRIVGLIALGEGFPKLEKLSLIWCSNVSSYGLIALAKKCSFLTALDLLGCYVGDHGLAAVGQSCKQLGDLNLRFYEALTDAGFVELALGCGNSLKALGMSHWEQWAYIASLLRPFL